MDNSKPYLDQENLDDIIVYSHSLEVWNPQTSIGLRTVMIVQLLKKMSR